MLVDDEQTVRDVTARMLERHGYAVVALGNPEEAAVRLESGELTPDLVVTDLLMPRLNGWTLARRVQPHLPFLFISGHSGHTSVTDSGSFDSTAVVSKPFTAAELTAAVRRLLDAAAVAA